MLKIQSDLHVTSTIKTQAQRRNKCLKGTLRPKLDIQVLYCQCIVYIYIYKLQMNITEYTQDHPKEMPHV